MLSVPSTVGASPCSVTRLIRLVPSRERFTVTTCTPAGTVMSGELPGTTVPSIAHATVTVGSGGGTRDKWVWNGARPVMGVAHGSGASSCVIVVRTVPSPASHSPASEHAPGFAGGVSTLLDLPQLRSDAARAMIRKAIRLRRGEARRGEAADHIYI
jgi:hypothetical protein